MHVVDSPCNISHNIIYRMVKRMKPGALVWQDAMRLHLHRKKRVSKYSYMHPVSTQRCLCLDWVQADLGHRFAHQPCCCFCYLAALF